MAHPSDSQRVSWPANPLDAAREAFAWLCAGDHPVTLDGRRCEHLPARQIPVDELRDLLLQRSCPRRVWDQVWRHVIPRARQAGGTWTIVAVGLALPMLTPMAARLTHRYADDPTDIHAEVLRGFLTALHTVDLAQGRITIRLRWAAYRAGHHALSAALDRPTPKAPGFWSATPTPPAGHPDLVLARAVAAGVLTETDAEVISATRIGDTGLTDWAREHTIEFWAAYKVRKRAEHRLLAWLTQASAELPDTDPTGHAATSQTSPSAAAGTPGRSRAGAKNLRGGMSKEPPKSGLQGCG